MNHEKRRNILLVMRERGEDERGVRKKWEAGLMLVCFCCGVPLYYGHKYPTLLSSVRITVSEKTATVLQGI